MFEQLEAVASAGARGSLFDDPVSCSPILQSQMRRML